MIEYLTLDDVLALIDDLGVDPIRDIGLLDSAVHRPQVTVYGDDAYPDIDQKARCSSNRSSATTPWSMATSESAGSRQWSSTG